MQNCRRSQLISYIALAVVLTLLPHESGFANTRSNAYSWIAAYGESPPDGKMIRRVQSIFARVKRASGGAGNRSRLFIVESNNLPWAVALQDRNIILTRGAIDVIYGSKDSIDAQDARMAFVIGHELKHVLDDDFWHEEVHKSLMKSASFQQTSDQLQRRRRDDELRADEEGFIYASLAGFSTDAIFQAIGDEDNFLSYWARQTNTISGSGHYSPEERIQFLADRYKSLDNAVEFFKYGVRLAHFGRLQDARVLFAEFETIYSSNQVAANLGYVQLQLARRAMPAEVAFRYWLPGLMSFDPGMQRSASRTLNFKLSEEVETHLTEAIVKLESARAKSVSGVVTPTDINLITAYLYSGKLLAARALLVSINNWENDPRLVSLNALIVMEDTSIKDPWDTYPREDFQQLASEPMAENHIVYNYARLLAQRGRHGQAKRYWGRLLEKIDQLPRVYQVMTCREMRWPDICTQHEETIQQNQAPQWVLDIKPGDDIDHTDTRERLKRWGKPFREILDDIDAAVYRNPVGNSFLALDGIVELLAIKQHGFDFKEHLRSEYGPPQAQKQLASGETIWSYGSLWSAVVDGNTVREIWIAQ